MKRPGPEERDEIPPLFAFAQSASARCGVRGDPVPARFTCMNQSADAGPSRDLRAQFEAFHAEHPQVYAMFERFALDAIYSGADTLGAKAVWERLRWETATARRVQDDAREFRLNNNLTAYYARLFMETHPEHAEVFRTRRVKAEPA